MFGKDSLILVTGASGFLATHIIQQLQQAGHRVRGTVRSLRDKQKVAPLYDLCPEAKHQLELVEARLEDRDCWSSAVKGCTYVMHVASPFPAHDPRDEQELIAPAVNGTRAVLEACRAPGSCVKRVVLTSSTGAVDGGRMHEQHTFTEEDWSDLDKTQAYYKSKILAERAAWQMYSELSETDNRFELSVCLPGIMLGPLLLPRRFTSSEPVIRLLTRDMPLVPKLSYNSIDVRDAAAAHIAAMTKPEAVGKRHILATGVVWMRDIALILHEEFHSQGYRVPTRTAPNCLVRLLSLCDSTVRMIVPLLGLSSQMDNTRLLTVLRITPRPVRQTIVDMGYSIIEHGLVNKTRQYRGPPPDTRPV